MTLISDLGRDLDYLRKLTKNMNKRRAIISRSRKRLHSVEDVKHEDNRELDKLRAQIKSLERENAEIRGAAERNAMKMIAVARKNSDYIDELGQLKSANNELTANIAALNGEMDDVQCELARQKSSFKSIADVAVKQREQIKSMTKRQTLLEGMLETLRRENGTLTLQLDMLKNF